MRGYMRTYDNKYLKKWRQKNRKTLSRKDRARYHAKPLAERQAIVFKNNLQKKCREVGLTVQEFWALSAACEHRCYICGETVEEQGVAAARLVIDHAHATNKFRGLLCGFCNTGLGLFRDRPDLLRNAVIYLETRG